MDTEWMGEVDRLDGEGARYFKRRYYYRIEACRRTAICFFAGEEIVQSTKEMSTNFMAG